MQIQLCKDNHYAYEHDFNLCKFLQYRKIVLANGDISCWGYVLRLNGYKTPLWRLYKFASGTKLLPFLEWQLLDWEDDFCLELSKLHTYDDVVERVAQKLGLEDPSKIRLTPHNCYSQQPKPHPIKYRVAEHLLDMLVHYNQISDILYYEVLDIPLPELQCLKTLKVAFHHANKDEANCIKSELMLCCVLVCVYARYLLSFSVSGEQGFLDERVLGASAHSDYGIMTLLMTDGIPGLQLTGMQEKSKQPHIRENVHHISGLLCPFRTDGTACLYYKTSKTSSLQAT
ncbi:hypothetical protein POM88_015455 [Heracleum sosnowskyi]|uniref:Ubiquitin carboxyl-terminal hydrolase 7 ICP0-binding domain-containing protein n=1 Tax=Heracleum sosnowskyi TaxID=360622 RepID=A0AAD8IK96_9APIA|nr:hypothetical protein POM88_015455 [Heracleum sosnowskyi]